MRADWDLMRKIVLAIEEAVPSGLPKIVDYSDDEVGYHAHLLIGNGLAEGFSARHLLHDHPYDYITNLTMAGHEFAELTRDDARWTKAMEIAHRAGAVSLNTLKHLLISEQARQLQQSSFGLSMRSEPSGNAEASGPAVSQASHEAGLESSVANSDNLIAHSPDRAEGQTNIGDSSTSATRSDDSPDFSSAVERNNVIAAYTAHWSCSEASLARTAKVDPADLTRWKQGSLTGASDKKTRIEIALRTNAAPTPAKRPRTS
jgi:hypothetical protein